MKSISSTDLRRQWARAARLASIVALTMLSSYCSRSQTEIPSLSEDEMYLVDAYVRVVEASDLYSINHLKSESLFTFLDSTIDTVRIANTIRALNSDPDRWLLVFRGIERDLQASSQGQESKETR